MTAHPSAPRTARARSIGLVAVAGAATFVALLVALQFSGAAEATTILDAGVLVRWGLPVITSLADIATAVTLGALTLCAVVLPAPALPGQRASRRTQDRVDGRAWRISLRVAAIGASVWFLIAATRTVFTYGRTSGRALGGENFGSELVQFVTTIPLGQVHLVATILVAALSIVCAGIRTPTGAALAAGLGLIALVPIALTGHAAGALHHELAVSAMWLHLAGMALWIGGLVLICVLFGVLGRDLVPAARRYSQLALWSFAIIAVSGFANAYIRLGGWSGFTTRYGILLLAKIVIFALLGFAGWLHRERTIPRLAQRPRMFWRIAAGEVVLMGAVIGISVALAASQPPVPQDPVARPSPAMELTRNPLPAPPSTATWLTEWRFDVIFAVAAAAALGVYIMWVWRLRKRGDHWSLPRTASWIVGCLLFFWVTNGGPAIYGVLQFSAHMLQHMSLAMVIPIFFVLGAPVTLAMRALPARSDGSRGPREWLLAFVHSRWAGFFSNPIVAAINFAGSMFVFYYSPLFELALSTHVGHMIMVIHFTLAGYLFANALIGIDPGPARPRYPLRLLLLFATMAFHAFFGVAITQATTLFAADHFGALGLPWWVDALADQRTGGLITWGIGEIPTLILAVSVAVAWARSEDLQAKRADRRADRDGDAELAAYNAHLASLAGTPTEGSVRTSESAAGVKREPSGR
ncbi:MAG TPA: cytochrome c oxidase assembly protein [Actinomycetaceae bacterium]|nr:cytochrome c oxidase assembly protein [Actinomycetaceae bacterium]